MYNDYLGLFGNFFNLVGTIVAVLCILKMNLKDILYVRSTEGFDNSEFDTAKQIYYARTGVGIIVLGFLLQSIAVFTKEIPFKTAIVISLISILLSLIWQFIMRKTYIKNINSLKNQ
ncbi:hypothetical protein LJC58_03930 [Lachnospiraceae bacterium OttesenSCG-928-D06]|nr:hypothetical protein [Lachnospiraceae bacterium OttesenSCG-928-D06]